MMVALVTWTSLPAAAQSTPLAPSASALCRALRAEIADDVGPVRCRVIRTSQRAGVRAAVLRISTGRMEELRIAVRGEGGWRAVAFAGTAYSFQDLRGALEVRSFAVADVIRGGRPEIDLEVRRWQSELDPPDACSVSRQDAIHRYVCADRGGWRCMHVVTEVEPERALVLERPCPFSAAPSAPGWSIDLRFTASALYVRRRSGDVPPSLTRWIGEHSLAAIFSADPGSALATLPDTI